MCGVVGIYSLTDSHQTTGHGYDELRIMDEMLATLRLRGPDARNAVHFGTAILGHTRLSIIDLQSGDQPIYNEDQSIAVVFNGEIYNFLELRKELKSKGHVFSTSSDTEVIVHLYEEVGPDLFSRLDGMFAILLHDRKKNVFIAGRDRLGEKPLLYWQSDQKLLVASELKALLRHPDIRHELNHDALALYFSALYIPAPHCIVAGVHKLPPAHYLMIEHGKATITQYWQPLLAVNWQMSEEEAVETCIPLFRRAVTSRTVADVPLGVFLSGGIDSSAVTAFLSRYGNERVKSFSVGFADETDERPYARTVANLYQTDHTELYVDDRLEDVLEQVLRYFDEPFGDSSAIPTYLVSREARKHVKVVLTGDGGDELFAGYGSYLDQRYIYGSRVATKAVSEFDKFWVERFGASCINRLYSRNGHHRSWPHWHRVRTILSDEEISSLLKRPFTSPSTFFINNGWLDLQNRDPLTVAFNHDIQFYLPDDLLKKVDMASMMASIECRAPFLDHRLVEFALTIPPLLKVKNRELKYILKQSLRDYLPHEILYRKKQGFGAPVGSWMRNQLRELVHDSLCKGCRSEQYLEKTVIDKIMARFYDQGGQDYRLAFTLWMLLVLELWLVSHWTGD